MTSTSRPPRVAYILHWFPKPSETFIFREVVNLWKMGVPLRVYSLYGECAGRLSPEMRSVSPRVERLGLAAIRKMPVDLSYWAKHAPAVTRDLFRTIPVRKWSTLEQTGENLWSFACGFRLARLFKEAAIEHIHAPWANGPATAAWVASRLTGVPFSFTARAGDIYPPDGALSEKIRAAQFVRSETGRNIEYLTNLTGADSGKFLLTYNGVPLSACREAPVYMVPPYRLLAVGRFVGKKGFDVLLRAAKILEEKGLDFHLTLAGSGHRGPYLKYLTHKLGLGPRVSFPGFVSYDYIPELFRSADVFVMPSVVHSTGDRDGIPTVIMEALLHRLPVIATDVSGIGEVIRNRETGLLIPQKDAAALARSIETMLGDRPAALEMAENGRTLVHRQFDPEKNHRNVLEIFRKAVAGLTLCPPER